MGHEDLETLIEFRDKQKEALDYFFKPYYDKQQQEKEELHNLISAKQKEVEQLLEKLHQMQGIQMRTFNKMNTTDVKKARKQSKELRKLKMSKNTVMFIETDDKLKGQDVSYNEDCYVHEGEWQ